MKEEETGINGRRIYSDRPTRMHLTTLAVGDSPQCDRAHGLVQTDNMTSVRFLELLLFLLLLLLHQVSSEEAEPMFRAEGGVIEMGYCFGVDYIVVYRSTPEGDRLLGNSSADDSPVTPPADLRGRVHINKDQHLLGLQIRNLTHTDSGIYRRECWQNQKLVSQHAQELLVCELEVQHKEIIVKEQDGGAELLCNSTSIGLEGTSVRWYSEMYPSFRPTLFLDSSVSLDPLVEELQGGVEVRHKGALLLLDNNALKNNQQFYCIVIQGKKCLSFQDMYLPVQSESRDVFASQGDRVVLNCPSEGKLQQWQTPQGKINGSTETNNQMFISSGDDSEDFSLVIPAVSDDHLGQYTCVSTSLEVQYSLVLCPKKKSQQKVAFKGGNVFLDCEVSEGDPRRVQWHRQTPSGENELIQDSKDKTVPIPADLRSRVTLSDDGSSLKISLLGKSDGGVYWCVVLAGPQLLEEGEEAEEEEGWPHDYTVDPTAEDDFPEYDTGEDDGDWPYAHRCIFKQETILRVNKGRAGVGLPPVNITPADPPPAAPVNITPTDPPPASNVTAIAVGGALVGLLVVVVIVVGIIVKRKSKASPERRKAARSGKNTTGDIKLNVDPGCTESLTQTDG